MLNYLRYDTPFDMNYYVGNNDNEESNEEYINELKAKYNNSKKILEDIYNELYNED